jgi:hypothetical protein
MATLKYLAASTLAFVVIVLLCATVQQWDERDAALTLACHARRCT